MPGVKKVVQVGDNAVAVVADTWWQAKTALEALPIDWDEGAERQGLERTSIADMLKEGLDAEKAFVGNQDGDAKAAHRRRRQEGRGGLRLSVPEPRHHGADERHGALYGRQVRGLVPHAERRGRARRGIASVGPAGRKMRGAQGRCSAAASAGAARSDYVTQAVLIAKEMPGTPIKLIWSREEDMAHGVLSPDHAVQATGALRQGQQPDRAAHAHLRPVDPGRRAAVRSDWRTARDPATFQGLNPARRERVRLHHPEPADRPCHAQPARPARVLARREQQPERHLSSSASSTSSRMRPGRTRWRSAAS